MWTSLKSWWASLPTWAQTTFVIAGTAAGMVLVPVISQWSSGQSVCMSGACWKGYLISAARAAVAAVLAHWIPSNFGNKK